MFQRLKLLRRLQEVDIESLDEGLDLLERVKTNTSSAEERERLAHLIRVTAEVTDHLRPEPAVQPPPVSKRSSSKSKAKRKRQLTKAARRRQRASSSRWQGMDGEEASSPCNAEYRRRRAPHCSRASE